MVGAGLGGITSNHILRHAFRINFGLRSIHIRHHPCRCLCRSTANYVFVGRRAFRRIPVTGRGIANNRCVGRNSMIRIIASAASNAVLLTRVPTGAALGVARSRPNMGNGATAGTAGPTALRANTRIHIPLFIGRNRAVRISAHSNDCLNHMDRWSIFRRRSCTLVRRAWPLVMEEVGCSVVMPMFGHPSRISRLLRDLARRARGSFRIIVMRSNSRAPYRRIYGQCRGLVSVRCCCGRGSNPNRDHGCNTRHTGNRCLLVLSDSIILPRNCLGTMDSRLDHRPTSTFNNPSGTRSSFASARGTVSCSVASFFAANNVHNKGGGVSGFCPHSFGVNVHESICLGLGNFSGVHFNRSVSFSVHVFGTNYHYHLFPRT